MTYSTPLTAWALTPPPEPRPPLLRDFTTYVDEHADISPQSAAVLSMATHPAVMAGLARTPETAAEFDEAAARAGVGVETLVKALGRQGPSGPGDRR